MITKYDIDGETWTAITAAGEKGICWLKTPATKGTCRIYHGVTDYTDIDVTDGYPIYTLGGTNKHVLISADDSNDVFYAKVDDAEGTAVLLVDVI